MVAVVTLTLRARKALRPEKFCARERCPREAAEIGRCVTHAREHLDRSVRNIIIASDTKCAAAEWHRVIFPCGGPIQVNHKIERELLPTRWDLRNVLPGCRDLNLWAKKNPRRWRAMLRDWEGAAVYDELERIALSGAKPDYTAIAVALGRAA